MILRAALLGAFALALPAMAQSPPGLLITVVGPPVTAIEGAHPGCDRIDIPDAPARAIRLADGTVQLYATHFHNRVDAGPGLLALRHDCAVVMQGAENDDPAAFDDRAWIASPWSPDGRLIWAVIHDEFQGHRRPALCPSGRYMDCWYNALTQAVSRDAGRTFQRAAPGGAALGGAALVAALPYRYDAVGPGHHGYFNPSNIVTHDGAQLMFAFATHAGAQREGNCLLRTTAIDDPGAWRAWDGAAFAVRFIDPYAPGAQAPERHVCAPVGSGALRWPVTSLVRHAASGLFIAVMQDAGRQGGVYYATSAELLHWSSPALLLPAAGPGAWTCPDPAPIAYPSLLDPASADRNFETAGTAAVLYAVRFNVAGCRTSMDRELVRWPLKIEARAAP